MADEDHLSLELDFERALAQSRLLSLFRRNPSTWELLLMLAQYEDGSEDGVYSTIDSLQTRYLGNSAMLKFVRERRDDGLFLFTEHTKRSKWKIALAPALRESLLALLEQRNTELRRADGMAASPRNQLNGRPGS